MLTKLSRQLSPTKILNEERKPMERCESCATFCLRKKRKLRFDPYSFFNDNFLYHLPAYVGGFS